MIESELIEEILWEASACGVREEVIDLAKKFIEEGHSRISAYEMAFKEYVKEEK